MAVKRKDFQKTAAYIHQFLMKLDFTPECAEVRDSLNLALLYMQKYYRSLRHRAETRGRDTPSVQSGASSARGLASPMTPFSDSPDKFQWRWPEVDSRRFGGVAGTQDSAINSGVPLSVTVSRNGDLETLKTQYKKDHRTIDEADCLGRSPLMHAVQHNQYSVAEWLLRSGANVNASAHDRSTALHVAISRGHADLAELLLKYQASPDEQDVLGRAPLHWSVTIASTECLKLLLRHRADPRVRDTDLATPAMWACRLDRVDHFALLNARLSVTGGEDDKDASGRTYVHWAVRRQDPIECLRNLLTVQTALITDHSGKNALMVAAEQGSLPACKLILDVCKDLATDAINQKDQDQRTAAHLATLGGHGEVLNYLLDCGANLEFRDSEGASLWDYAKQRHLNYCKLIIASHCRQRYRDADAAAGGFGLNSTHEHLRGSMPTEMSPRPPTTPPPTIRRRLRSLETTVEAATGAAAAVTAAASRPSSAADNWAETSGGFDRKESEDDGLEIAVATAGIPDPLLGLIGASTGGPISGGAASATVIADDVGDIAGPAIIFDDDQEDFNADDKDRDPASESGLLLLPPPPQFQAEANVGEVDGSSFAGVDAEAATGVNRPVPPSPRPLPTQLEPLGPVPAGRRLDADASTISANGEVLAAAAPPAQLRQKKKKTKRRTHSSIQQQQEQLNGFSSGPSPAAPLAPPGATSSLFRPLSPRSQLLDGANAGPPWLGHQRLLDLPAAGPRSTAQQQQQQQQLASGNSTDNQLPPSSPSGMLTSPPQGKGIFFPVPGKPRPTWLAGHSTGRGSEL